MNLRERFRKLTLANQANVLFGAVVTVATVGNFVAVVFQYRSAQTSSVASSVQTDQLIAAGRYSAFAADKSAQAASNFAESARGIDQGVRSAVTRLQAEAAATELARETSETNSKAALQATIDNFHKEQRAWVGLTYLQTHPDPQLPSGAISGGPALQEMSVIVNTGRTPARHVIAFVATELRDGGYVPDAAYGLWMARVIEALRSGKLKGKFMIFPHLPKDPLAPPDLYESFIEDQNLVPPGEKQWVNDSEIIDVGVLPPNVPLPFVISGATVRGKNSVSTKITFGLIVYNGISDTTTHHTYFCNYTSAIGVVPFKPCSVLNDMQ